MPHRHVAGIAIGGDLYETIYEQANMLLKNLHFERLKRTAFPNGEI